MGIDKPYAGRILAAMFGPDDIRAAREKLGESQAEFAKRLGVNQSTVHHWEKKGLPDRGTARVAVESLLAEVTTLAEAAQ